VLIFQTLNYLVILGAWTPWHRNHSVFAGVAPRMAGPLLLAEAAAQLGVMAGGMGLEVSLSLLTALDPNE